MKKKKPLIRARLTAKITRSTSISETARAIEKKLQDIACDNASRIVADQIPLILRQRS